MNLLNKIIRYFLRKNNMEIILYGHNNVRIATLKTIYKVQKETEMLCSIQEAYQLCSVVQRTNKIPGDIVEIGVYKGATAKLICLYKSNKQLHLFDTFEGLPEAGKYDSGINHVFIKGMAKSSYSEVRKFLNCFDNIQFYKGFFPNTVEPIKNKKFSFVHIDVDLYQSTKDCIEFFYPRMSIGGIILIHDYNYVDGVSKAIDEFMKDKQNPIIGLPDSQCMIMKIN